MTNTTLTIDGGDDPHICRWCGYVAVTPLDGVNILRSLNDHFYSHPECWDKEQGIIRLRFLAERESSALAKSLGKYHPEPAYRVTRCADCGRDVYQKTLQRPRTSCPHCISAKIKANKRQRPAVVRCDGCGNTFIPKRVDARYCSSACRQSAYRRRVTDKSQ